VPRSEGVETEDGRRGVAQARATLVPVTGRGVPDGQTGGRGQGFQILLRSDDVLQAARAVHIPAGPAPRPRYRGGRRVPHVVLPRKDRPPGRGRLRSDGRLR